MNSTTTTRCLIFLPLVSLLAIMASCGGGSNTPSGRVTTNPQPDYSKLKPSNVEAKSLTWATSESLALHLKNGIRLNTGLQQIDANNSNRDLTLFQDNAAPMLSGEASSARADGNYSETNTHVNGVDEADYVKYDGSHIFAVSEPQYTWNQARPNASIRILATDPEQAAVNQVAEIPVENDQWGAVSQLYLVSDSDTATTTGLATLRSSWSEYTIAEPRIDAIALSIYPPQTNDKVEIKLFDVSDITNPEQAWKAEIDGYLQDSRKIGNTLYLVSQYSPSLPGLIYYPMEEAAQNRNEELIADTDIADLLPKISINGGEEQPLVEASRCLIPVERDQYHGFASITTIVAIDLDTQEVTSSLCLNSRVQGIYASEENLYIGGSSYDPWVNFDSFTVIHKISLNDGQVDYRSTGLAPGTLGWQDPAFRMDEHEGFFRVVSTSWDLNWEPLHRLSVFQDSNSSDLMEIVASLPNDNRPATIGKPNEDIYSVRFRENLAYIVTFERIDPLYILDLNDPLDPFVAGELEVPGFSSYLHPINDNYLLGFGYHVNPAAIQQGFKVSLFDVSDTSNPQEVNNIILGEAGSYSQVVNDLRAASFMSPNSDQLRFTTPFESYGGSWNWENSALQLFEVNGLDDNTATLSHVGSIISEESSDQQHYPITRNDRGVLHDDAVYYIHGDEVFSSFWSSPQAATGPH